MCNSCFACSCHGVGCLVAPSPGPSSGSNWGEQDNWGYFTPSGGATERAGSETYNIGKVQHSIGGLAAGPGSGSEIIVTQDGWRSLAPSGGLGSGNIWGGVDQWGSLSASVGSGKQNPRGLAAGPGSGSEIIVTQDGWRSLAPSGGLGSGNIWGGVDQWGSLSASVGSGKQNPRPSGPANSFNLGSSQAGIIIIDKDHGI